MKAVALSGRLTIAVVWSAICFAVAAPLPAATPFESASEPAAQTEIDQLVQARLEKLGLKPASICSDAVFVRRVYLDVIGSIPTVKEANDFLLSKDPNKRAALIERLLAREEYADYWAMRWSDVLRIKAEFPINLWPNAAQAYHRWVRTCVKENLPYDRFAREMLTASGSNFRVAQVNFYRAMQNKEPAGIAQTVALTFMGARADQWAPEKLAGMAAFFSQIGYKSTAEWKEEIVFYDPGRTNASGTGAVAQAGTVFPDGSRARLAPDQDPRQAFADWLIDPKNPWFTRCIANRAWAWLMGRGIIHEPDDIRPDNPPCHPELLACLERELVAGNYDLKRLYRLILNSKTYQRSSVAPAGQREDETSFAHYPLRRLEAEVLIDALCQITGTTETYSSAIPEPFTYIPEDQRSISLPDGSITSPFLELFGRPPRDTGQASERNSRLTAAQSLHLLNSSHIQKKLEQSRNLQHLLDSKAPSKDVVSGLYLLILSRYPTDEELKTVAAYSADGGVKSREAMIDLAWALINTTEFLYRH